MVDGLVEPVFAYYHLMLTDKPLRQAEPSCFKTCLEIEVAAIHSCIPEANKHGCESRGL